MIRSQLSVLTVTLILLFLSPQVNAQLPTLGGLKNKVKSTQKTPEEKLAAKMEKSEATMEIKAVEAAMKKLNWLDKQSRGDSYFSKNKEKMAEFETPYFALRDTLPLLKKKDSKWKTAEYEAMLDKCNGRYPTITEQFKVNGQINDVVDFIGEKRRMRPDFMFGYRYKCSSLDTEWTKYYAPDCPCADMHYDFYVNKLELKKLRKKMAEYKELDPDGYAKTIENSYNDAWEHYWTNFDKLKDNWLQRTETFLASAEAGSSENEFHVQGILDYHKRMMETMIDSEDTPDDRFVKMAERIDEVKKSVRANQMKENHVTPERIGTILFTSVAITRDQIETATPITEWTIDQPLYFRWFTEKAPIETHSEIEHYDPDLYSYRNAYEKHVVTIDGVVYRDEWFRSYGEGDKELYKSALTMRGYYDLTRSFYTDMLKTMIEDIAPGKHKVKIEIFVANSGGNENGRTFSKEPIASGEITMNVTNAAIAKVMKSDEICFPPAGMRNGALEAQMIKLFKEKGWKEIPKKAVIIDKGWNISKNKYTGAILKRWIDTYIISTRDGECIKQNISYAQDYAGGGNYGPTYFYGIGDQDTIGCKCLK